MILLLLLLDLGGVQSSAETQVLIIVWTYKFEHRTEYYFPI